ncbi:hypothetical protein ES708_13738 [subsurface metagenome]
MGLNELAPNSSINLAPTGELTPVQTDIFIATSLGKLPCSCILLTSHNNPRSTNIKPLIPTSYIRIISAITLRSSSEPLWCSPPHFFPSSEVNCLPISHELRGPGIASTSILSSAAIWAKSFSSWLSYNVPPWHMETSLCTGTLRLRLSSINASKTLGPSTPDSSIR